MKEMIKLIDKGAKNMLNAWYFKRNIQVMSIAIKDIKKPPTLTLKDKKYSI